MKQTYFASDEKICLATDIAERELSLLSRSIMTTGTACISGYRSVRRPVCIARLPLSVASWAKRVDSYLDALEREIEFAAVKFAGRHLIHGQHYDAIN